jgi:hypothetical protein
MHWTKVQYPPSEKSCHSRRRPEILEPEQHNSVTRNEPMKTSCYASTILAALFLSIHDLLATEPLKVNANGMAMGAVEGENTGEDEATDLAKQLANPISALISVPFQANEDFGYGPSHNGYKFTLNIQPVIPISLNKDWNLILRTIFPIVSQHDLFYVENVPKSLHIIQNRS